MLCANSVFFRCMPVSSFIFIAPLVLLFFFVSLNWLATSAFCAWPRPYSFSF